MLNFIWTLGFDSQEISPLFISWEVANYVGPHRPCLLQAKDVLSVNPLRLPAIITLSFTCLCKPQVFWLIYEMLLVNECYPCGNSQSKTISLIL